MQKQSPATEHEMFRAAILQARDLLAGLPWGHGLTREDIRVRVPTFPQMVYLRLPASKRFVSANDVLHEALNASARAEGEFMHANLTSELPDEREVLEDGGPPAWGEDPIIGGYRLQSGSATDTEGLDPATDFESQFERPYQR